MINDTSKKMTRIKKIKNALEKMYFKSNQRS